MSKKIIYGLIIIGVIVYFNAPLFAQEELEPHRPDAQMQIAQPSVSPEQPPWSPAVPKRTAQPNMPASKNEEQIISSDSSGKITLELKGMDILDALKLLSKKSGLNIVAGKNVRGNITIYLKEVDVWDALRIILETNELAYEKEGNIVKVMTARDYELTYGKRFNDKTELKIINLKFANAIDLNPALNQIKSSIGKVAVDEKSNTLILIDTPSKIADMQRLIAEADVSTVTQVFNLNYTKAEDLEKKLTEVITKGVGRIRIDTRTNKAVITDTPKKMSEIEKIITAFDERHREVLIEAKIMQVILNDNFKMGVNWEYLLTQYHSLDLKSSFGILADTDKKGKISIGTVADNNDYTAFMEALNTIGTTNILSSPRIATVNNEEAKILVGSTEPYVTTTTTTTASGPATTAETVNFIDVGVKLYVTPVINQDKFITMKIKPEVSSVTGYLTTSENNKIPIKETSEAETNIMVKDGVTIVIGGLMKNEDLETLKKVPLFGDLPLLGALFRSKDKTIKKTELVVFLTPHIISGDTDSYGATKAVTYTQKISEPTAQVQSIPLIVKGTTPAVPATVAPAMTYEQYCQAVKDKVYTYVEKNYPEESISGKVELSFILTSSGALKGEPTVDNEVDSRLKELTINSLKEAAPFGSFPKDAGKDEDIFHLAILYE
jgi:type II secretory pathway component GspD/PulD (secretin)